MEIAVFGDPYELDLDFLAATRSEVERQVREYESRERTSFDIGVRFPDGFRGSVMRTMAAIPYGETRTYGELATELGSAGQAVGQACGANPVPIVVPCHRVRAADSLGGFSSRGGVEAKRRLLAHERNDGSQSTFDAFVDRSTGRTDPPR